MQRLTRRKEIPVILAFLMLVSLLLPASALAASDVEGHWAEAVIESWVDAGKAGGYADGTFRPNAPVTRAEFSVLLARAMNPAFLQPAVLTARATQAVQLLMASDLSGLSAMVHPTDGVRISPTTMCCRPIWCSSHRICRGF